MGQTTNTNPGVVVEGAQIGCSYAQLTQEREQWDKKYLKIEHCDAEKVHGVEVAHNHDCVAIKNIPKFEKCVSPYYYNATEWLSSLYPQNPAYKAGFEKIKEIKTGKSGRIYPPCVLALLDSWFDYSDVEISKKYQIFMKETTYFSRDMKEKMDNVYSWGGRVIYEKRRTVESNYKANSSNAADVNETGTLETVDQLKAAKTKIDNLYKDGGTNIKQWQSGLDNIQIFEGDYATLFMDISGEITAYYKKWGPIFKSVGISTESKSYNSFINYYKQIADKMITLGQGMDGWEDSDYELLKTSFLICKCGGVIEFLTDGQERILYCNKLFSEFVILLENAANYLQELLNRDGVYPGVDQVENDESITSAKNSLLSIVDSFNQNKDFLLDKNTTSMQIRFITKGYNAEKGEKISAMIGIMFLTPVTLSAGTGMGVALSVGMLTYDFACIGSQDEEEKKKNETADAVTISTDVVSYFNSMSNAALNVSSVTHMIGDAPIKMTQVTGNALVAVGFVNSLMGLFYTSDEDWIEEIEITVLTRHMAHIVKQGYKRDVTPKGKFDGATMVRGKTITDYRCDSLGNIKWDELEGVSVAVDKDYGGNANQEKTVENPDQVKTIVKSQTNGELKE